MVAAQFTVSSFVNEWTRMALQVRGQTVKLFLNCDEYDQMTFDRVVSTLSFDPASTLFLGQGGDVFGKKYTVRALVFFVEGGGDLGGKKTYVKVKFYHK